MPPEHNYKQPSANSGAMPSVTCQLNGDSEPFELASEDSVDALKRAIFRENWKLFFDENFTKDDIQISDDSGAPIDDTWRAGSGKRKLFVNVSKTSNDGSPKRTRVTLARSGLPPPTKVLPLKLTNPKFVGPENWLGDALETVLGYIDDEDDETTRTDRDNHYLNRVPPMSVVRCSRGGKTRALSEIANAIHTCDERNIAALFISFNDSTSVAIWEQDDPLQALLRRIHFEATNPRNTTTEETTATNNPKDEEQEKSKTTRAEKFVDYLKGKPTWEEPDFLKWLGDCDCVLLVDELNKLDELTKKKSKAAEDFGTFLKVHFLGKRGRHFVFSSHRLGTNGFLGEYIDTSQGSARYCCLHELPLVQSLKEAQDLRDGGVDSTREVVYYGLFPGMIHEAKLKGKNIAGKRGKAVENAMKVPSEDLNRIFLNILRSLIKGSMGLVPEDLHIMLDSVPRREGEDQVDVTHKIRWIPYHLQFVFETMSDLDFEFSFLAEKMRDLCNLLLETKEKSGEGWEGLFVLFLLARCLTRMPDETFVPDKWFELGVPVTVVFNESYDSRKNRDVPMSECKTWNELKAGLVFDDGPQLTVLYPTHSSFEVYDVFVVYSNGGKRQSVYGYQLKEGDDSRKRKANKEINSLYVKGAAPQKQRTRQGWITPNDEKIDIFFGCSGKYWTPKHWRLLSKDSKNDDKDGEAEKDSKKAKVKDEKNIAGKLPQLTLSGAQFYVMGGKAKQSMRMKGHIEACGGTLLSSLSKSCHFLIYIDDDCATVKSAIARHIPILKIEEFGSLTQEEVSNRIK